MCSKTNWFHHLPAAPFYTVRQKIAPFFQLSGEVGNSVAVLLQIYFSVCAPKIISVVTVTETETAVSTRNRTEPKLQFFAA